MPWTIIVASADAAQLELLMDAADAVKEAITTPGPHRTLNAMSVDDIARLRQVERDPATELLIVTADLPDGRPGATAGAQPGFALVKRLQEAESPPACILVSDRYEHLAAVVAMKRCELLPVGAATNYVELCCNLARKLGVTGNNVAPLVPAAAPEAVAPNASEPTKDSFATEPFTLIEVSLRRIARSSTVQLIYNNPACPQLFEASPLALKQAHVDEFVRDSQKLRTRLSKALAAPTSRFRSTWQAEYRALGERIYQMLSRSDFPHLLGFARGKAANPGDIRLRFNLERTVYDGLWEAMFDGNFLMLDTTVARRVIQPNNLYENRIYSGDGVLRVLAVRSDVPDGSTPKGPDDPLWRRYWKRLGGRLAALSHLNDEMKILRELQKRSDRDELPAVSVEFLRAPTALRPNSLADKVKDLLKKHPDRYDILHFSGHALFSPGQEAEDDRGYLVFSGYPEPKAVPIAEVAHWLEGTSVQLVYLSCCRSSAAQAAFEFARHNIPMTIGFTWDLDDRKALDFAENFYTALLEERLKVCLAFRAARRKLHNKFQGGDPIWASPVLFAQPVDWTHVERALRPTLGRFPKSPLRPAPSPRRRVAA
jgi:hypothetical protein